MRHLPAHPAAFSVGVLCLVSPLTAGLDLGFALFGAVLMWISWRER